MKLHRLTLTNYRGITHRDIEFPENGVVVISGANEVGKTSMIEALDLLLEAKDRSTKREVKQVKPTHADVGSEVSAEISTGPYRFVYRKRFHKKCETQLTVLAPRREQLTGDEAHERVRSMLGETLDTELWRAQRVMQTASTAAVDLSGCDALSRALDVAAGQAELSGGCEPLLVDRIDQEYALYFTPTGRPTGQWAAALTRLRDAELRQEAAAAAVAEIDDHVNRHAALTGELAQLGLRRAEAVQRGDAARVAAEAVAALGERHRQAKLAAESAESARSASTGALTQRRWLRSDVAARAEAIARLEVDVAEAAEECVAAAEVDAVAAASVKAAVGQLDEARAWAHSAAWAMRQISDRDELDQLTSQLGRIDLTRRELERNTIQLASARVTDVLMRRIEHTDAAVHHARELLDLASTTVDVTAAADVEFDVDGRSVRLAAGESVSVRVADTASFTLPNQLTATLTTGSPASESRAKLDAALTARQAAYAEAEVTDVDQAREQHQRWAQLTADRQRLEATLSALTQDRDVTAMRTRLAQLHDHQPAAVGLWDVAADSASARADLDEATANLRSVEKEMDTLRKVAAAAAAKHTQRATTVSVLREKLAGQRAEWETAQARLELQRAEASDDALIARAEADADALSAATAALARLQVELAEAQPELVAAEWDSARTTLEELNRCHARAEVALREVVGALTVFGTEGRKGKLDAAHSEREHAAAEHQRVGRRARAARTLRAVMERHRQCTRQRYVDPFRAEIERLARPVFGPTFEVEVDSSLRIQSRTLGGRTVPYDSLSGGAKEQLGILARLAGAALVAKEDTVPVVIDDALGLTDPDRLARMGAVFDAVGGDGQVIVLTCTAARYDSVQGAHRIEVTA